MSIASMAIRLALTGELLGKTIVGDAVYDSSIAPIDHFQEAGDSPFVSIAVEDQSASGFTVRDVMSGDRAFDLVIEIASGHRAHVETSGGTIPVINLSESDAGKELTLDLIERQVLRHIMSPVDAVWGAVLQSLVVKIDSLNIQRGIKSEGGIRLAFRQILLSIVPIDDPLIGHQPEGVWQDFLTACEADSATAGVAPSIRAVIVGDSVPAHLLQWVAEGMKPDAARGLSLLSADGSTEPTPTMVEVEMDANYAPDN